MKVITQPGTNLNTYDVQGKYYFSGAVTPVNIPVGINGWLVVYSNGGAVKQLWYRVGTPGANDYDTYVRTCTNGTWGAWTRYLTNADIDGRLFFSASGTTAIESFDNTSNRYRLQVGTAGTVRLYHSSDGGKTWANFKEIAFTS